MKAEYDFSKGKRGAVVPQKGKTRISIFIDNAVLDEFRARAEKAGTGYQTMMNEALRQYLAEADQPVTERHYDMCCGKSCRNTASRVDRRANASDEQSDRQPVFGHPGRNPGIRGHAYSDSNAHRLS